MRRNICFLLTMILIVPIILDGCINSKKPSERIEGLSSVIDNINCSRYEFEIHEYLPEYDSVSQDCIGIIVCYNGAGANYLNRTNDLLDIKKEFEKYINENTEIFEGSLCYIFCYSLINKESNIPKPYIYFGSDIAINSDKSYYMNSMEINDDCFVEQFKNINLDVERLIVNEEYTYLFDPEILLSFPKLQYLNIPSNLCTNNDLKKILPKDCEIEYNYVE